MIKCPWCKSIQFESSKEIKEYTDLLIGPYKIECDSCKRYYIIIKTKRSKIKLVKVK